MKIISFPHECVNKFYYGVLGVEILNFIGTLVVPFSSYWNRRKDKNDNFDNTQMKF